MGKKIILFLAAFLVSGCSTTISLKSEPIAADVFALDPKTGEKKAIGKTPLELPAEEVRNAGGELVESGEYFSLVFEKDGYRPQTVLVPASRFGTMVTQVVVSLKEGVKDEKLANEILDRLFLAQSLARKRQFERAQIEIDKILTNTPTFARALSMRASIYFVQGNLSESLKWYQKALDSDPQLEEAVQMTTRIRSLQGGSLARGGP